MIIDSLARTAAEDPRRLAMIVNLMPVTYAELWRGAGIVEARIKDAAIPRGARVGVAVADLRLAWFTILALEKMGYPAFAVPQNAHAGQLNLANTAAILIDGYVYGTAVLSGGPPLVDVSAGATAPAQGLGGGPERPDHERFVLFSSGTTGLHKKVQLTGALRDLRLRTLAQRRGYSVQTRHFVGNLGPWTVHGYLGPLAIWSVGGTVILHQIADMPAAIAASKPNRLFATPGLAEAWMRELGTKRIDGRGLQISIGGGPINAPMFVALQEAFPGAAIQTVYGTTECGAVSNTPIRTTSDLDGHVLTGEAEVQIVDPAGTLLPPATAGAIRMRSPAMVRQYLDDASATAAFFRDGWFYPGDMGAIGYDGRLILTGRFAEVVNLRGDKVAPGDIEEPIRQALNAHEVAVLSRPVSGTLDELHVFIVEGSPLTAEIIKKALAPLASAFSKIGVHRSHGLPRTTTGKVQYGHLRTLVRNLGAPIAEG